MIFFSPHIHRYCDNIENGDNFDLIDPDVKESSGSSLALIRLNHPCMLLCRCCSLASLRQMGFLHHMEEVTGAALLPSRLRSIWNVHPSHMCLIWRACSDRTWLKKEKLSK